MVKPAYIPSKPPRPARAASRPWALLLALALGAAGGGYTAHVLTRNHIVQKCRMALQDQVVALPALPPSPAAAPASAPAAEPAASAAAVGAPAEAASAPPAQPPAPPALPVDPKPPPPKTGKAAPATAAARGRPRDARTAGDKPAPTGTEVAAPNGAGAPLAQPPASAPPRAEADPTPRNPQVVARNGDTVFVRMNERVTLQVKKGEAAPGLGVLQRVDADGAWFESGHVPTTK